MDFEHFQDWKTYCLPRLPKQCGLTSLESMFSFELKVLRFFHDPVAIFFKTTYFKNLIKWPSKAAEVAAITYASPLALDGFLTLRGIPIS